MTKLMENGLAVLKEIGLDEDEESKQWLLDLWLTALRSERYEQITRKLWRVDRGCDCFCAIGVLANEIQPFTTVNLFREGGEDATYCIADWLTPVDVASCNDEGWTFEQIAKEIERYENGRQRRRKARRIKP